MPADPRMIGTQALVTGAGGDIGGAVAAMLSGAGATVCLVGRTAEALRRTCERMTSPAWMWPTDLTNSEDVDGLVEEAKCRFNDRLDILVHCAGEYSSGTVDQVSADELDRLYKINAAAPFQLTQRLLSMLKDGSGHVAFINSTQSLETRLSTGQYAASQHARKAITDSFRLDMNAQGIHVLALYVGRTAGSLQEKIFREEGLPYRPDLLLQPSDIATAVINCLTLPETAEVTSLTIRSAVKSY
jgi:NADP-dependent 3-hydroxy acid dehydrogenase YdfG